MNHYLKLSQVLVGFTYKLTKQRDPNVIIKKLIVYVAKMNKDAALMEDTQQMIEAVMKYKWCLQVCEEVLRFVLVNKREQQENNNE